MKTSKLLYLLSGVLLTTFLIYSCKDDFSEKDFLTMQANQAATNHQYTMDQILYQAQLARSSDSALAVLQNMLSEELYLMQDSVKYKDQLHQLRHGGLLLSWTIQVQDNHNPLDSVKVYVATTSSISTDSTGTMGYSDANGYVTFNDVPVGRDLVMLSKSGYMTANVAVEFTANQIEAGYDNSSTNNGGTNFLVVRRQESTILPLFSNATGAVATVWGNVVGDFDLTNDAMEPAIGATVQANMDQSLMDAGLIYPTASNSYNGPSIGEQTNGNGNPNQRVLVYTINGGPNVGTATVDSTGHYKMIVPAISDGMCINMVWQSFKKTVHQAMRWDETTGLPLDTPKYMDVTRFFGPDAGAGGLAPIQFVPGASASFPAPDGKGSGFALKFTAKTRSLATWNRGNSAGVGNLGAADINAGEDGFYISTGDAIQYMLVNGGSADFTSAPTITVSAPDSSGTTAKINATIDGKLNNYSVTARGTGYALNDAVTFDDSVKVVDANGNSLTIYVCTFTHTFTTGVTGGQLPTSFFIADTTDAIIATNALLGNYSGLTNITNPTAQNNFRSELLSLGYRVTGFTVTQTGTSGAGTGAKAAVNPALELDGLNLSDGGAGYTKAPTFTFSGGGGSTQPVLMITRFATQYFVDVDNTNTSAYNILPSITMNYQPFSTNLGTESWSTTNTVVFNVTNADQESGNINDKLVIDGSGNIQYYQAYTFWTSVLSVVPPYASVMSAINTQASAFVWVNNLGQVEPSGTALALWDSGSGYTSEFGVTINPSVSGAPGSGAVVQLTNFNHYRTGEVAWTGSYKVVSPGSGYYQSLNFPHESYLDGYLFGGGLNQYTRSDQTYSIFLMSGEDYTLPYQYNEASCITVYPGDTYEVDANYGSGAEGKGTVLYPGWVLN